MYYYISQWQFKIIIWIKLYSPVFILSLVIKLLDEFGVDWAQPSTVELYNGLMSEELTVELVLISIQENIFLNVNMII